MKIETRSTGKRELPIEEVITLLLTRGDGAEIMIDGALWTRMNRERNVEEGMDFDEYKVSPHANLNDEEQDYDKDCDWIPATREDLQRELSTPPELDNLINGPLR